jgi:hypothetical protein
MRSQKQLLEMIGLL